MTLPVSFTMPSGEAKVGTTTTRAFRAVAAPTDPGASFELALGAMITPAQARTPPAEIPVELVLEGEWRIDLEQAADEANGPVGMDRPTDAGEIEDGAIVPLGKSLESWLAVVGRRAASVATDVRRGAAEEMVDLVTPGVTASLATPVPSGAESLTSVELSSAGIAVLRPPGGGPAAGPVSVATPHLGPEVDPGLVPGSAPVSSSAPAVPVELSQARRLEQAVAPSVHGREPGARRLPAELGEGEALLDGDAAASVDRTIASIPSPYSAGLPSGGSSAPSAHPSEPAVPSGYADRLINPEASNGEPAETDAGIGRTREPVRSAAGHREWGADRMPGMMDLLDEGLDPEALLARYEARHPAVEIGGFSFPLDALDAVAEGGRPASAGRGRVESAEASAYDRLRGTTLGAQSEDWAGSGGESETGTNGRESGGKAAEHRAAIATRGLDELRVDRPVAAGAEPITSGPRTESVDPVLVTVPSAGRAPVESGAAEAAPMTRPATVAANEPADRIARRVEHLMLNIADDQGEYGRLKVSVTGTSVRATILPNDPVLAERLTVDLRQLRQQLGDRGFADAVVTVQAPKVAEAATHAAQLLVRDVVETNGFEVRVADRPRTEENRRDTPRDPRDPRDQGREEQRPSHRSRDQRQDKRGGHE